MDRGDGDDDIDVDDPAKVVDGEDELLAAMARDRKSTSGGASSSPVDRYTADRKRNPDDADWVQFQLESNQMWWSQISGTEDLSQSAIGAMRKLKASAYVASQATNNRQLSELLTTIVDFKLE